jgi:Flp pilus assembly protein TadD
VALNDLGIARDLLGRHAEAQAAYRLAVGAAPGSHAAEVNLALSLALSGHAAEGAQLLRPLIANPDASPRAKQDMAAVAALAEDRSTAEALLKADLNPQQVRDALTAYELLRATPPRPN